MSGLIRYVKEKIMANGRTPGTNTGKTGGIFQEVGPRGGRQPNFAAVGWLFYWQLLLWRILLCKTGMPIPGAPSRLGHRVT